MTTIDPQIQSSLLRASMLAMLIDSNGKLKDNYKQTNEYQLSGFVGDVQSCSGGVSGINAGLVGKNAANDVIVVFRGTDGFLDIINDLKIGLVPFVINKEKYSEGLVHEGFLDSIQSILEKMLINLMRLEPHKCSNIYITGHSKGGALATLMGMILSKKLNRKVITYTYGSPRVGNATFKNDYNSRKEITHFRVEVFLDVIPHLPFTEKEKILLKVLPAEEFIDFFHESSDYCSVGQYVAIDNRSKHKKYITKLPIYQENPNDEKLNSFYAVYLISKYGPNDMMGIHNMDYYV